MTDVMDDRYGSFSPFGNSETGKDDWNGESFGDDPVDDLMDLLFPPLPSQEQGYFEETDQPPQVPMNYSNSDQVFYGSDPYIPMDDVSYDPNSYMPMNDVSTTEALTTRATSGLSSQSIITLKSRTFQLKNVSDVSTHIQISKKIFSFNPWQIRSLRTSEAISNFFKTKIKELSKFISFNESGQIVINEKGEIQPILFNELGNGKTAIEINVLKRKATLLYAIILSSRNFKVINCFLSTLQQCIISYIENINILIALFKNAMASHSSDAIKLFTDNGAIKTKITNYLVYLCSDISEDDTPEIIKQKQENFKTLIYLFKNAMASNRPDAIKLFTDDATIKKEIKTYLENLTDINELIALFKNAMASHSSDAIKLFTRNDIIKEKLINIIESYETSEFIDILKSSFSSQRCDAGMFFLENFYDKIKINAENAENPENKIEKIQLTSSVDYLYIRVYTVASTDIMDSSPATQKSKYIFYNRKYFTGKGLPKPKGESQKLKYFLIEKFSNLFEEKQKSEKRTRVERDKTKTPDTTEKMTDGTRPQTGNGQTGQQKRRRQAKNGEIGQRKGQRRTRNEQISEEESQSSSNTSTSSVLMEPTGEPTAESIVEPSSKRQNIGFPNQETFNPINEQSAPTSLYAANGTFTEQGVEYYGMPNVVEQEYQQFTNMGLNDAPGVSEIFNYYNDSRQSLFNQDNDSGQSFMPTSSYAANGTFTEQGVEYYGMPNVVEQEYQQVINMGLNDNFGRKERLGDTDDLRQSLIPFDSSPSPLPFWGR